MPFQDEDEVTTSDPRPAPNRVEKMLRRIFIEDWSLKLLSLAIATDPPRTVDVILTGSRNKLDDLTSLDLVATVDISDQRAGERVLRLADKAQISLPPGGEGAGFRPSAVSAGLEAIVERQVP